jgi:hypothetical protein
VSVIKASALVWQISPPALGGLKRRHCPETHHARGERTARAEIALAVEERQTPQQQLQEDKNVLETPDFRIQKRPLHYHNNKQNKIKNSYHRTNYCGIFPRMEPYLEFNFFLDIS